MVLMALVSILDELKKAQAGGYALPLFDTPEMAGTQGIFAALEAKRSPGIVALWSQLAERPNTQAFLDYIRALAKEAAVPVSLMLDHGNSVELCSRALSMGFTDLMYDGSALPLEENIANTRKIVEIAHAAGAAVEAELGHVGQGSKYASYGAKGKGFTDAASVERFVTETGVDMLAAAVGTAHGQYAGEPKLDLELLAQIRKRTDVPLVLHGGSGLSDEQFKAAIKAGVCKVNVFTDLGQTATARVGKALKAKKANFFDIGKATQEAFCARCSHYADVFGSAGKA